MLNIVGCEDGELDGTSDTIVSTEGSTLCLQPFSIHISLDGILVEIELHIHQFIANHIHVALEDDGVSILISWGGSLANQDVASLINYSLKVVALAKFLQVLNHVLLVLRRTRNLVDFSELLEHESRF